MAHSLAMGITGTGTRAARAAVFAALCVTLSAGAHVLLSGAPLPLVPLTLISLVVLVLAFALAGRERGFGQIAALLIPLELAADTVFTTGQQTCYGPGGGPVTGPARALGVDLLCAGGGFGTPLARAMAGPDPAPLPSSLPPTSPWLLLAAHIAVGLLAAGWLRHGERALVQLLRAAAAAAFRPLLLAVATCRTAAGNPSRPHRPAPRSSAPGGTLPLLIHSVVRRGPPCRTAAV